MVESARALWQGMYSLSDFNPRRAIEEREMRLRSFQTRILLWTWAVLLVALAVIFFYSTNIVGEDLVADTEARSWRELDSIKWLIDEHEPFAENREFDSWLEGLGFKLGQRISYISDGRVLADSEVPFPELPALDDHSRRPEILAALEVGKGVNQR